MRESSAAGDEDFGIAALDEKRRFAWKECLPGRLRRHRVKSRLTSTEWRGGDQMESSGQNSGALMLVHIMFVIGIVALIVAYIVIKV
jgi:hypothetical protein